MLALAPRDEEWNTTLRELFTAYKAWEQTHLVAKSDSGEVHRQGASLTSHYVSYISVPSNPLLESEIADLERLLEKEPADASEREFRSYIIRVVTARLSNLVNFRLQSEVNIISLGFDCLPRLMLSKWGFRPTRMLGEKTLPFDLAYGVPPGPLRIIRDDFDGLLNPEQLVWNENLQCPMNAPHSLVFNHEHGAEWKDNNYAKLRGRYEERIGRFRRILANGKPTICLMNYMRPFSADAEPLLKEAAVQLGERADGRIRLLCILSDPDQHGYEQTVTDRLTKRVTLTRIKIPRPSQEYIFYDTKDFASSAGFKFELRVIEALRDTINIETGIMASTGTDSLAARRSNLKLGSSSPQQQQGEEMISPEGPLAEQREPPRTHFANKPAVRPRMTSVTGKKHDQAQISDVDKTAQWQARLAKMTPQRRAKAERRRAERALKQVASLKKQLEKLRAANAAAPPKRGLSRLLGGTGRTEVQALQSRVGDLEEKLGTVRLDLRKTLKSLQQIERRLDRAGIVGIRKNAPE